MNIRQVFNTIPASNGTQDYTISGFGTVQFAIVEVVGAVAADNSVAPHIHSYGVWDGTNVRSISAFDANSVGTTNCDRSASNSNIVSLIDPAGAGTINRTATISAITDGIRLTWNNGDCDGYTVRVLIGNGVVAVDVDNFNMSATQNNTASTTSPGFEPDVIFTLHARQSFNGSVQPTIYNSIGVAVNKTTIEQGCVWHYSQNATGTSNIKMLLSTQRVAARTSETDATYEITSFDSSGFTVTTRDATAATVEVLSFLAIKLNGTPELAIDVEQSPLSTGNEDFTSAGFEPEFGFAMTTAFRSGNENTFRNDTRAGPYGIGMFNSDEERCNNVYSFDNVTTTVTRSRMENYAVVGLSTTSGNRDVRASFVSWLSTGVRLNYNDVDGSERMFLLMLIKDGEAAVEDRKAIQRGIQIGLQRGIQ